MILIEKLLKFLQYHKKCAGLKKVSPRMKKNEDLKAKILDNAGDLSSELNYIYKERYEE